MLPSKCFCAKRHYHFFCFSQLPCYCSRRHPRNPLILPVPVPPQSRKWVAWGGGVQQGWSGSLLMITQLSRKARIREQVLLSFQCPLPSDGGGRIMFMWVECWVCRWKLNGQAWPSSGPFQFATEFSDKERNVAFCIFRGFIMKGLSSY